MKTHRGMIVAACAFVACLSFVGVARAQKEESERRVKMKDLPAAVRQTVREQAQGARLRGLSRETEGGKTFYEAELWVNGHGRDVLMDEAGAVVEVEETVALASLPE